MSAMKLYAEMINLDRARDRRELMRAELARAGISAEFFPAFDFKEHSADEVARYCRDQGPWGAFARSHQACTISHSLAWERFLESDADIALIMEDDIHISPDTGEWLRDLSWWPADADMVKIERWNDERVRVLLENGGVSHMGREVRKMLTRHMGAAGYMLNRRAAQVLLESRPFDMVIDHILFNMNASRAARALNIYQIVPALVRQGNEPQDTVAYMQLPEGVGGVAKLRREIRRGLYELALPASTWAKFLTRRARLYRIPYRE